MASKKPYRKPVIVGNEIFSLTSNGCDTMFTLPGPCENLMWDGCAFFRKSPNPETCLDPPDKPIFKS